MSVFRTLLLYSIVSSDSYIKLSPKELNFIYSTELVKDLTVESNDSWQLTVQQNANK